MGESIRKNANWIEQFHAADDPLVPIDEGVHVALQTESNFHKLERGGHFQADEFPELLEAILERLLVPAAANSDPKS
eukprot:NODE_3124_length_489_cov_80.168182_g2709_i0.p2 GENE.NODE_3124_length_489_cov_80.168182_g2709_i0~~NODE_3124_length_489_cov_80.168182_g2709_i0.p2  ORF type:complete len:77 (+),score=12.82 NODE_3124_length_489_cov_80.168182_g2709_i0:34-264(+)